MLKNSTLPGDREAVRKKPVRSSEYDTGRIIAGIGLQDMIEYNLISYLISNLKQYRC